MGMMEPPQQARCRAQDSRSRRTQPVRLIFVFRKLNSRSYGQNMRLGSRLVLVIEADRAVGAKVISVSGLGGMAALDAVHSATGHHFTVAVDNQIDLFGGFMMMRKIGAARRKVHPEEAHDDIGLIDGIPGSPAWTG